MWPRRPDGPGSPHGENTHSELSGNAGDVVQARDVSGGVHFHGPHPPEHHIPRQLPGDVRGFVNRVNELEQLGSALILDGEFYRSAGVCVIAGTAGVGKTALALRWAHQIAPRFPDGQLYMNLRGYDPGAPITAKEVLDRFLRALDVPVGAIPPELEDRATLYRSRLAGRRMLIVLDNAANAAQVRPLLPGTDTCLVIVTSRNRLSGLVARDGANRVPVDFLAEADSLDLIRNVTAPYRKADSPAELAELARLCARLPLALRIAGERAASRPWMPLRDLIRDLRDESALWDALTAEDGDEADAVRTVFAWSYRALPEPAARSFRLLGLHPGPEFGAPAAAATVGSTPEQVRQILDLLVGAYLLEQTAPDRYEFHDLMRAYAMDQAAAEESAESRHAVLRRVITWYLHSAARAQERLAPFDRPIRVDESMVTGAMVFPGYPEALRWFQDELANLTAAVRTAARVGLDDLAWQLAAVTRSYCGRFNTFEPWFAMATSGLEAARRAGNRHGEAEVLDSLGKAYVQSHQLDMGAEQHERALGLWRELGDRLGEALSLNSLGLVALRRRRLAQAHAHLEQSVALLATLNAPNWEMTVRANLAEINFELGDLDAAAESAARALDYFHRLNYADRKGNTLRILSMVYRESGRNALAREHIEQALAIARDRGNPMWEAYWLLEHGKVLLSGGDAAESAESAESLVSFQRSASIHRRLGDRSREARALDAAGEAYRKLGRHAEALEFHRRAAATHRELADPWQLAVALENAATAVEQAGTGEDTTPYLREALAALDDFDDPRARALHARILERNPAHQ
ncbi:ATP-binding protein [Acrocarpospora catenulata]|uniref:ATP-binding protein n=1 Tax=Acrocarpospora catenulata TaxID=2836182 RepID=UPI002023B0E2|nr:tetratricopeptide repeat protein [Acrocarpospora catenulata]